jgi:hypothetical protein
MPSPNSIGTIVHQSYSGAPVDITADDVASAQAEKLLPHLDGWTLRYAFRDSVTVRFSSPSGSTSLDTIYAVFGRGAETLHVEVISPSDTRGRAWIEASLRGLKLVTVPLGRGMAGGPSGVIDRGDKLMRLHYNDGVKPHQTLSWSETELVARLDRMETRVSRLMMSLT